MQVTNLLKRLNGNTKKRPVRIEQIEAYQGKRYYAAHDDPVQLATTIRLVELETNKEMEIVLTPVEAVELAERLLKAGKQFQEWKENPPRWSWASKRF